VSSGTASSINDDDEAAQAMTVPVKFAWLLPNEHPHGPHGGFVYELQHGGCGQNSLVCGTGDEISGGDDMDEKWLTEEPTQKSKKKELPLARGNTMCTGAVAGEKQLRLVFFPVEEA
jgi:hypothetical protein